MSDAHMRTPKQNHPRKINANQFQWPMFVNWYFIHLFFVREKRRQIVKAKSTQIEFSIHIFCLRHSLQEKQIWKLDWTCAKHNSIQNESRKSLDQKKIYNLFLPSITIIIYVFCFLQLFWKKVRNKQVNNELKNSQKQRTQIEATDQIPNQHVLNIC